MKKAVAILFVLTLMFSLVSFAEEAEDWSIPPVFTKAYEQSAGKVYIEWEGNAPLYQIFLDGNKIADVTVSHHVLDLSKGTHSVMIYPIYVEKTGADNKVGIDVGVPIPKLEADIKLDLNLDLASLGLEAKNLIPGNASEALNIDYKANPIIDGTATDLSAVTDFNNNVVLSFNDQYNADEYEVMIKKGNNANYVTFYAGDEEDAGLIIEDNALVSLVLDRDFLAKQDCPQPVMNEEYKFSVLMRKYARDYVSGEKIRSTIHSSKTSSELTYKPTELWKTAPAIDYASQTADGEITLRWSHEDGGLGCEYAIMKINKIMGVMTGEEQLGITKEHEFIIRDLANGGYCFNIVPTYGGEKGTYSVDANVEVKNDWVIAPALKCEQTGDKQVKLTWKAPANIEQYHITVYTGDNNSILRFVDLDYSKYTEFDLTASEGDMEYIYEFDKDGDSGNDINLDISIPGLIDTSINLASGQKLKFEIYGIRHTESGAEQKSATSSQTINLK